MKDKAFTLIELLIVVLIIGILAAIALPQYTLAVNRARFANLRTLTTSLAQASRAYYLTNGKYPTEFEEMDFSLPDGFSESASNEYANCKMNNEMYCCVILQSNSFAAAISCGKRDYSFIAHYMIRNSKIYCVTKQDNPTGIKLCRSLGSSAPWTAITTPDRRFNDVFYYEIK